MAIEVQRVKKSNTLGIIILLLVLVIGGVFFYNFVIKETELIQPRIEEILSPGAQQVISAQLDINKILNNQVFLSLISHIDWPLSLPSQLGKPNPFSP
ncbi:MAG: hypothetical protein AB7D02_00805 [Candidatus Paceibacterota bacterium]